MLRCRTRTFLPSAIRSVSVIVVLGTGEFLACKLHVGGSKTRDIILGRRYTQH